MEEIVLKGIVIKSVDYSDSDKIVTIFSAEKGIITARARGVKKPKAKLAFAVQPFAFVEFVLFCRGDFYTIKTATSIDQFFNITSDFDSYILMLACLEVVEKSFKNNEPDSNMFLLVLNSLKAAEYENINPMYVFIKFMLETMKILGFKIEIDVCANCASNISYPYGFSFDFNGLICSKCRKKHDTLEISNGEQSILKHINDSDLSGLSNLKFNSHEDLISVIKLLAKDFRILVDEDIASLKQFL